jgi:branched-chain amino acid transport system substrate-binding protein
MAKPIRAVAVVAVGALGLAACASGGDGGTGGTGGGSAKTLIISTDLPLQGSNKEASDSTNNAIELYLKSINNKVGNYTIKLQKYDNSTAAMVSGTRPSARPTPEARAEQGRGRGHGHPELGLRQDRGAGAQPGPSPAMLMVSHANTNPGLTKTWDAGEPQKFFPSGKRSYARVITTDDYQGAAAAQFAATKLGTKKVYILNDNQTYGQGIAKAFAAEAQKQNIEVLGNDPWDSKQTNYTALFEKIKATSPDLVYIAGIFDLNGGQLVKDKVAVLGDNTAVKMMGPDGFTGYPELLKLQQGAGMYLTFAGLSTDQLQADGGARRQAADDYKAKYGSDPATSYALYGVAAVQVILAAIEKSDGTRAGVLTQVFEGAGITIAAAQSAIGKELKIDPATGDTNAATSRS